MKRVLLLPGLITVPLITLMLVSIAIGKAWGNPPSGFVQVETCRLPCWNGIRPGETRLGEAINRLTELGYEPMQGEGAAIPNVMNYVTSQPNSICQVGMGAPRSMNAKVTELTLQVCKGTSLGHIIDMLGEPESMIPMISLLTYENNQVVIVMRSEMCGSQLSPHSELMFISVTQPPTGAGALATEMILNQMQNQVDSTLLPWRGFLPLWRYDRLYPERVICF